MNIVKTFDTLYVTDSKGKIRIWYAEIGQEGDQYSIRNVSGIKDGKLVESGWKVISQKNVGKANETSLLEQAESQVQSLYDKQLAQGGYHAEIDNAGESKYIAPMLAQKWADVGSKIDYSKGVWTQPKLDGHRCIASEVSGLKTRKGKDFKSVPHIYQALWTIFNKYPGITFDGELYNHDLRADFNQLSSLVRKSKPTLQELEQTEMLVQYHIYDVVAPDMLQSERLALLADVFELLDGPLSKCIVRVPTQKVDSQEAVDLMYGEYIAAEYEGEMVRVEDYYKLDARPSCLIKRKEFFDEEGEILDIVEGEGNWAGAAKSLAIRLYDGTTCSSGIKGNYAFAQQLLLNRHKYLGNGSQATIRYPNKTPAGKPRFPVAVDICIGPRMT